MIPPDSRINPGNFFMQSRVDRSLCHPRDLKKPLTNGNTSDIIPFISYEAEIT